MGSQESHQHSSANSHKNSSEKRGKLSLISKRPSLRKISDFISFKEEGENCVNGDKTEESKEVEANPAKQQRSDKGENGVRR
jgi:hypothetical protein